MRQWRQYRDQVAIVGHRDRWAQAFYSFGDGAALMAPQGVIYNERYIEIGPGALIGPHVTLSVGMSEDQEMLESPVLCIGPRTVIGRGSHVVGHLRIEIGADVQMGPGVYVTDQNHDYRDPTTPIGTQPPRDAPVVIGEGSWIGAHAVVLPGSHLGAHTTVAAGAVVRGQFPSHVVLAGVPARVVRRLNEEGQWVAP